MPTFARLVSALGFAALAWFVTPLIVAQMPPNAAVGAFAFVNTGLGLVLGWWMSNGMGVQTVTQSVTQGLTVMVTLVAVGLFLNSGVVMIERAFARKYDEPTEAVVDVFALMLEHWQVMNTVEIFVTLLIGGALVGLVSQIAGRLGR